MTISIIVTIVLAVAGFIAAYLNNYASEKRKQRFELVNKKLNNLYGPLFVATEVGRASVTGFFASIGRKIDIDKDLPLTEPLSKEEEEEYRIWVQKVFMPTNEWCENVVRENAYLINEQHMPECVLRFISHVSCYKAIIAKWETKKYNEIYSPIPFPKELNEYAVSSYNDLKKEQLKLIEKMFG